MIKNLLFCMLLALGVSSTQCLDQTKMQSTKATAQTKKSKKTQTQAQKNKKTTKKKIKQPKNEELQNASIDLRKDFDIDQSVDTATYFTGR